MAGSRKTTIEGPDVSPYLRRRVRTLEEALEDIAASRFRREPAAASPWWPASKDLAGEAEARYLAGSTARLTTIAL
jgi:hypothetical protein